MRPTRATRTIEVLFAALLLGGTTAGCAQTATESVRPTTAFSRAQLDLIMYRRDQGDGLADIARLMGRSRPEIRLAERWEKARRREVRR
jgi:hypothetical protein